MYNELKHRRLRAVRDGVFVFLMLFMLLVGLMVLVLKIYPDHVALFFTVGFLTILSIAIYVAAIAFKKEIKNGLENLGLSTTRTNRIETI